MTAVAIGSSYTVRVTDGGKIVIATNGGEATLTVTPAVGAVESYRLGPAPTRQAFGPYAEGASGTVTNISCASLDADGSPIDISSLVSGAGIQVSTEKIGYILFNQSVGRSSFRTWAGPGNVAKSVKFIGSRISDPVAPSTSTLGSVWPTVDELLLRQYGIDATFRNCGIGSMSLLRHVCGQIRVWGNNSSGTQFAGNRASVGNGDRGDYGDVIRHTGGKMFRAKVGRARYCRYNGSSAITGLGLTQLDYIASAAVPMTPNVSASDGVPGASFPTAGLTAATTLGDTVADGNITWELVQTSGTGVDGTVLTSGPGFDPLGRIAELKAEIDTMLAAGYTKIIVVMGNGQSDAQDTLGNQPTVRGWYRTAHETIGAALLSYNAAVRTCHVLETWNPGLTVFNDAIFPDQFAALQQGLALAVTTLQGTYPGRVFSGFDWYALLGRNVQVYPEPSATSISGLNGAHPQALHQPAMAAAAAAALAAAAA